MAAGRGRTRRVSLPGVAELLRPAAPGPDGGDQRRASGREKHTQKITVYLSAEAYAVCPPASAYQQPDDLRRPAA